MNTSNMSSREKRIVSLSSCMLMFSAFYFADVLRNVGHYQFAGDDLRRLIWAVVAITGIEIAYHFAPPPVGVQLDPKDERDILIESKAYRNGYFAYGMTAFLVISAVVAAGFARISVTPFLIVNLLLLVMVLAELVKFGTQFLYYRQQS